MSKQQLTIEHLAPYLPYKLNYKRNGKFCSTTMSGLELDVWFDDYNDEFIQPILRPLSDLTKEIEHKGRKFVPLDEIKKWVVPYWDEKRSLNPIRDWRYRDIQKLLEWHFDVFGLIDKNLAVNLNELE